MARLYPRLVGLYAMILAMDSEEFVRAVKTACSDTEGGDVIRSLKNPPGRRPSASLFRLSKWFHRFGPADQAMLLEALNDAAEGAVLGFLCVLDGVRAIKSGSEKGSLELYYVDGDRRVLLNDPQNKVLHDIFQSMRSFD